MYNSDSKYYVYNPYPHNRPGPKLNEGKSTPIVAEVKLREINMAKPS